MLRIDQGKIKYVSRFAGAAAVAFAILTGAAWAGDGAKTAKQNNVDWPDFLGGPESSQYSPLQQINTTNVGSLTVAWVYPFPSNAQTRGNPLVIGDRMFVPSSAGITAFDSTTGRVLWQRSIPGLLMRGLSSWLDTQNGSRRIFYNDKDHLYAIDAATGAPIRDFGDAGSIDLKAGMARNPASIATIESQTPGKVFGNLIIVGTTGGEDAGTPPGDIRAFDVRSAKLVWVFHTIPRAGEANYNSWPEQNAWEKVGGANDWSEMTVDPASGILFVPLASTKPNFYGVNRKGDDLYGNSLLALDAHTGKLIWYFQTVHHDLWDYDLTQAPKLLTLRHDGQQIQAVVVASKTGYVFAFERRTGKPIFPIKEQPVPQSDVPGEYSSPTQPVPTAPPPFAQQHFDARDLSPYLPAAERQALTTMIAGARDEGIFTPPSFQGTIEMPSSAGGTNWGDAAVDPRKGLLFVVSANTPALLKLVSTANAQSGLFVTAAAQDPGAAVYMDHCAMCHEANRVGQPPMIPSLVGIAGELTAEQVADTVKHGRSIMPAFTLSQPDMQALLVSLGFSQKDAVAAASQIAAVQTVPRGQVPQPEYDSGFNFLFSKMGLPVNAPPWATLTAYDMNAGKILWQVPYGGLPGLKDAGSIFPRGSIVATAGGLIFGSSQDNHFCGWDENTGKLVFSIKLPSLPGGVPAIYMVGGREYIAVPAASYNPELAKHVAASVMPPGTNSLVVYALSPVSFNQTK
jgi:quinoprotein glucose dehydrogenase